MGHESAEATTGARMPGWQVALVVVFALAIGCGPDEQQREEKSSAEAAQAAEEGLLKGPLDEATGPEAEGALGDHSTRGAWSELEARRDEALQSLAVPVGECVNDRGEGWPAFDGCIDWHSSVHAHYALLEVAWLTADHSYAEMALAQAPEASLNEELALLEQGALDHENPYGFAWALLAARARELSATDDGLQPMAEWAYRELWRFLDEQEEQGRLTDAFAEPAYGSAAWAVTNMARWARATRDEQALERLVEATSRYASEALDLLPCGRDGNHGTSFFSPCLLIVHALVEVAPCEAEAQLLDIAEEDWVAAPLVGQDHTHVHMAGQNFARAWGYWSLFELTGEPWAREAYAEHMLAHLAQPAYWAQDHDRYAHWVAQFGVYALALSDPASTLTRGNGCVEAQS